MDRLPTVELLEATHEFPGSYVFKVIGRTEDGFAARIVALIRDETESPCDPPFRLRETSGGRHVAVTVQPRVDSAWQVLSIYARLAEAAGVVVVF